MTATARDNSVRTLLEQLKKAATFNSGLVISVVPRGDLQVAQPSSVPEGLLKAYAGGFSTQDRMSWQAIIKRKPTRASDAYSKADLEKSPYSVELLQPSGLKFALALPLSAPVIEGYPGAVHVLRTPAEGDFSAKEIEALMGVITQFDARRQGARKPAKGRNGSVNAAEADAFFFGIIDGKLKSHVNGAGFAALDDHLHQQILDHAKKQMQQVGGEGLRAERLQLLDSHGDAWIFRLVAVKPFAGLGDGVATLICRQPTCNAWSAVEAQDFQADAELSRLIPALKFMHDEYSRGPTLHEIAKQVHLSPFHFHRRFTELLGLTPKQFMLECQIHQCKGDLLGGDKELAQIAKDCGFAHQSHFTSRFKQTTGLTPTRWRRMMAERSSN